MRTEEHNRGVQFRKAAILLVVLISTITLLEPPLPVAVINAILCGVAAAYAVGRRRILGRFWVFLPVAATVVWLVIAVVGVFIDPLEVRSYELDGPTPDHREDVGN